ncbi:MAG: cell surface protein SprA [Tannerella sp.]|jgi:cell surface protein SprA|nr:cell surface protein SprA [Tannerella sp.]
MKGRFGHKRRARRGFGRLLTGVILTLAGCCMSVAHAQTSAPVDSLKPRYPVSRTIAREYQDLIKQPPADLHDPENVKTVVEYDLHTGMYIIRTKVGDMEIETPITLTPAEYQDYSMMESMRAYYRQKNEENFQNEKNGKFSLSDMQFDLGPAEKLFGPGGVRMKTQGSAEMIIGMKTSSTKNPSLPERSRSRTYFNFDTNIQVSMNASVGTKISSVLNYDTKSTFDFDASRINLGYSGEEDEIIKKLEGGNVSLSTGNSLIRGGAALFGARTELQFGKLRVNALLAQQNSESRSISTKGGAQTKNFELKIDEYDGNRHFFLAFYFREHYDQAMSKLPYISSSVTINRMEVWITNKRSNYEQSRNIVAFSDLGENRHISNPQFQPVGSSEIPYNEANTLYQTLNSPEYAVAREISAVTQTLSRFIEGGVDYEKIESARRLNYNEYTYNKQLGYISLQAQLQPDEVLAVAYEYTFNGNVYQVGEFSTDDTQNTNSCLYLKLLKGTSLSPSMPFWDLMMKNIYLLRDQNGSPAYNVQKDRFRLDVLYQSDTTGVYLNSIPEGNIANQILLRVMNLDRLDANNEPHPNGFYDFVEDYTIQPSNGRIIFPVVEPFGAHLRKAIGNNAIADKYVFQELYDSTLTIAQQIAEKNKFILRGEYRASSSSQIELGATNVARGSVVVTAGGTPLTENVDYTVDYISGIVTILNENLVATNTPIHVSLENQSTYNMQRKTMMGMDMSYEFSKNFIMGATVMHLSEMPLTTKTAMGDESIKNTLWGANMSYKTESQWLTNLVDKLPLLNLTQPSRIDFNAEFAHLIAGHYENKYTGQYSYLDDFESTQSQFDLLNPYPWALASVPYDNSADALFPEASLINNVDYGKKRALFAWYYIDGIFTRKNSSLRPSHITDEDISNHYVRAVRYDELFPRKELTYQENNSLYVLNLAYYPNERGPYNLDAENILSDGSLANPEKRWGGMMRRIEQSDFEVANIEYIEFWMMDPFIYNRETATGGDLYFNLGELSEDILRDEKKFFENGLPVDGDASQTDTTVWGKVPRRQSTVYAFDNTPGTRHLQDVGLNGLSTEEEKRFPAYQHYLEQLQAKLSPEAQMRMAADPFSPLNDPAGDNYHYFRGSDFDRDQVSILARYKHYNGTEGNSTASEDSPERYDISSKMIPDVEDLNQDNTLNENEKYYEYKISVRPEHLNEGQNYIVNRRTVNVTLPNGTPEDVTWYQFKIPVKEFQRRIGSIQDFKTIRFMRVYMTGFKETTCLRFGTFALVRGDWRIYAQDLSNPNAVRSDGRLDVMSVNIEENGDRQPVNYILPPGITRMIDPNQSQLVQQNEQALSLKVTNLGSQDARAIYKTAFYDLRRYRRLQLFVHAEKLIADHTELNDGELSVFMRLGSDYKNNYYEYEVPLRLTPPGNYKENNSVDREIVWPGDNMINFNMNVLTELKLKRNRAKRRGEPGVAFHTVYAEYDPDNTRNKISIVGNPSLAEVKTIMIGVRNNSKDLKSGEIWVNELRMTDFDEDGGWAANGTLNVALSDLGTLNAAGRIETTGFGGLDQSISQRSMDDYSQYTVTSSVQLGKFFPEKAHVTLPLYYAVSRETTSPKYNPLDRDILLTDALDAVSTKAEKDSIKSFSQDQTSLKSVSLNGVRMDIRSKTPMPYDPANFSFGYAFSENKRSNPETEYETTKNYQGNMNYSYTPYAKPFAPFANIEKNNGYTRYIKQFSLNYLPSSLTFQTAMLRNYYELQLRDMNNLNSGVNNLIPSFSQAFYWDRGFNIRWGLLNNLNLDFSSNTNARIEEPYGQVNKKLNPDQYKVWKDSVLQSIADLGRPLLYDQNLNVTYTLPLQYFPVLDWITGSTTYKAQYNWERGSYIDESVELGNIIKNQRELNFQGSLNLQTLYNKNRYLKRVNQKFNAMGSQSDTQPRSRSEKKQQIKFETTVTLHPDTGVIVSHGMMSRKVRVTARRASDSTVYRVRFKSLDYGRVRILNLDSIPLRLTVHPGPPPTENILTKIGEYSARLLMSVRRVNFQYALIDGMRLPGFQPTVGDWMGQATTPFGTAPGWGFALGDVREAYVTDAVDKHWMILNGENITPAMINQSKTFSGAINLEPLPGLKIDLDARWVDQRDTEIQYMYKGMPTTYGGTFTMTSIAFGGMFSSLGDARNGYRSKAFDRFTANREVIADRFERQYVGTHYPNHGFLEGSSVAGQPYNPERGQVRLNSADVLIPAFIAAYTGKDAGSIGLTPFPAITQLMPNWNVSYDGLTRIPFVKQHFKTFTLNHRYRCTYSVGNYQSYLNWAGAEGNLGFVRDVFSGNPLPSSAFEISTVNFNEQFSPLLGADATLNNNMTAGVKLAKTRNISLNIASYQLVETVSNDLTLSIGYKYAEFNKVLKMKKKGDFSNDLTVRMDVTQRTNRSLIRKIEDHSAQVTQGQTLRNVQFSADYAFSKSVVIRAFYDLQVNRPLVSSASYPTSNSNYGISLRLSLTQ